TVKNKRLSNRNVLSQLGTEPVLYPRVMELEIDSINEYKLAGTFPPPGIQGQIGTYLGHLKVKLLARGGVPTGEDQLVLHGFLRRFGNFSSCHNLHRSRCRTASRDVECDGVFPSYRIPLFLTAAHQGNDQCDHIDSYHGFQLFWAERVKFLNGTWPNRPHRPK